MTILLNNVSVDTTSDTFESKGGTGVAIIRGDNYGGGTVTIEMASKSDPNAPVFRFSTLPDGSVTADDTVKLDYMPVGTLIRAVLTGSSGANDVFVEILQ